MFPGSRNMDPHTQHIPHLREHSPSPYHYHPSWEPTPPHMKMDSFNHPPGFEPWPYGGKMEHNSCCNHSYPPGYYSYRPPYFHSQHPPQMYYPGPYPPYPDSYPPYFVSPPYHGVQHSRIDYDRDRNHCCGCPNHVCHRKEGSSVRIEEEQTTPKSEEEPNMGPKVSHSSLTGFPDSHNPWVPGNSSREGKAAKSSQPVLDFHEKFKGLQQGLGESTFKGDDKFSQLPYPIYWLPHRDRPEDPVGDKKEARASPKLTEGWPSIFRKSPLKLLDNEKPHEKSVVMEEEPKIQNSLDRVAEKERKIRTIPVVHLGSGNEKLSVPDNPDEEKKLSKSVTVEKCDASSMKKDSSKKQQAPVKTSKLPPVCLRVDPLPKKNVSNVKARPLSSSECEEKGKINKDNSEQAATLKNVADKTPDKDVMVIDVKDKPSGEKSNETAGEIVPGQSLEGIIEKCGHTDGRDAACDAGVEVNGETDEFSNIQQPEIDQHKEKVDTLDNKINNSEEVKNLSAHDAALLIQSAYRGFSVRRSRLLEKLRKIERIRGEVTAVKVQIQNYEASSERSLKQRVAISEAIMNLLLELDAIQGLLPSLREVRRSVASELVLLQEKLDQLTGQRADEHQQGTEKKDEGFNPASVSPIEENVSEHETEASSMAFEHKSSVLDNKTSCAFEQDDEGDGGLVPSGSNSGEASVVEKPIGEDVVSLPLDCEVTGAVLKLQPEEEVKFDTQLVLPLKPDEGSRQYLLEEAVAIKDDEIVGERDGRCIAGEGNVAYEVEGLENHQLDPVLSTRMNLNQAGDVEAAETHKLSSVNNQSGSCESPAVESSAILNDQGDVNSQEFLILPPIFSQGTIGGEGGAEQTNSSGSAVDENGLKEEVEDGIAVSAAISRDGKSVCGDLRDDVLGGINERKLAEENAELRQMLESLLHAGREQMRVISDMNDRVRNLEKWMTRKKKVSANHNKGRKPPSDSPSSGEKVVAGSSS